MLNRETLRDEIYRRHNKRVDVDDPIFMNITLNDLVLSHYLEKFQAHLDAQSAQVDEAVVKRMNDLLEQQNGQLNQSIQSLSGLGDAMAKQVQEVGNLCLKKIQQESATSSEKIEKASTVLEPYWCFLLVAVGLFAGILIQKFFLHL